MVALRDHRPYNAVTGATHVAAFVSMAGEILCTREDVGRHALMN